MSSGPATTARSRLHRPHCGCTKTHFGVSATVSAMAGGFLSLLSCEASVRRTPSTRDPAGKVIVACPGLNDGIHDGRSWHLILAKPEGSMTTHLLHDLHFRWHLLMSLSLLFTQPLLISILIELRDMTMQLQLFVEPALQVTLSHQASIRLQGPQTSWDRLGRAARCLSL